jgi:hypothetical protein
LSFHPPHLLHFGLLSILFWFLCLWLDSYTTVVDDDPYCRCCLLEFGSWIRSHLTLPLLRLDSHCWTTIELWTGYNKKIWPLIWRLKSNHHFSIIKSFLRLFSHCSN